jgi:hypothetical protein
MRWVQGAAGNTADGLLLANRFHWPMPTAMRTSKKMRRRIKIFVAA